MWHLLLGHRLPSKQADRRLRIAWTDDSKLHAPIGFMIKNSKDKSKQGNQFKTYSYFVGGVFHASETNFFFVSLLFFFPVCWQDIFQVLQLFISLFPGQQRLYLFYVVFIFFSWSPQPPLHLRLVPTWIAPLLLKSFCFQEEPSLQMFLIHSTHQALHCRFSTNFCHLPLKNSCAEQKHVHQMCQMSEKKMKASSQKLDTPYGYPVHPIYLK